MKPDAFIVISALLFAPHPVAAQQEAKRTEEPGGTALPFVPDFDPKRYLGTWYEVARLPLAIQPDDTLAKAEYSATEKDGNIVVKNTAYNAKGEVVSTIQGAARIAPGDPPGRLLVAFGPAKPVEPNYHVIYVDPDYQHAVVGVPNRRSLWILARKVPVSDQKLDELRKVAKDAGFDVSKLIVAPWSRIKPLDR